jgi:hypothetical protein
MATTTMASLAWIVAALAVAVGAAQDVPLLGPATPTRAKGAAPCTTQCANNFAKEDKVRKWTRPSQLKAASSTALRQ